MKTTGLFRTHIVEVKMREPGQTFHIIPFGDVHRDSPMHAYDHWQDDLAEWRKMKDCLFIGLGDYTDFLSTSERVRLRSGDGMHESTDSTLDVLAKKQIKLLAKEMEFMRGKLIGLVNGNHYYQFKDGTTGDHMLANELGTEFLGVACFVRIVFFWPGKAHSALSLDIFCHHGAGSGQKPHTSLGAVARMAEWADADIVLQGHDHKRGVLPLNPILTLSSNRNGPLKVKERSRWAGRTGSYLKAYIDGEAGYNVDAGRGPCSLGHIRFDVTPTRTQKNGVEERSLHIRAVQ
jgi:hypothetical protein